MRPHDPRFQECIDWLKANGGPRKTSVRRAWEALAPAHWHEDARRRFIPNVREPTDLPSVMTLCGNPQGVEAAEELAREAMRRMGRLLNRDMGGVVHWRVLSHEPSDRLMRSLISETRQCNDPIVSALFLAANVTEEQQRNTMRAILSAECHARLREAHTAGENLDALLAEMWSDLTFYLQLLGWNAKEDKCPYEPLAAIRRDHGFLVVGLTWDKKNVELAAVSEPLQTFDNPQSAMREARRVLREHVYPLLHEYNLPMRQSSPGYHTKLNVSADEEEDVLDTSYIFPLTRTDVHLKGPCIFLSSHWTQDAGLAWRISTVNAQGAIDADTSRKPITTPYMLRAFARMLHEANAEQLRLENLRRSKDLFRVSTEGTLFSLKSSSLTG